MLIKNPQKDVGKLWHIDLMLMLNMRCVYAIFQFKDFLQVLLTFPKKVFDISLYEMVQQFAMINLLHTTVQNGVKCHKGLSETKVLKVRLFI